LLPSSALWALESVMREALPKHGKDAWRGQEIGFHILHAQRHLEKFYVKDEGEDHLAHAACRLLLALALRSEGLRPAGPCPSGAAPSCAGSADPRQVICDGVPQFDVNGNPIMEGGAQ
jgi:hypothetical protein